MTYQMQAGQYLVTFKSHAGFVRFRVRVAEFLVHHTEQDAHEYAQRIAWRYYAEPVVNGVRVVPDVAPIPMGLWSWMKENWADMVTPEAA